MAKRRKSKNYLNNRDLYDEMVASKEQDKLTPKAEKMLVLLAERAINKMSYVSEDDRSDCLQFAILFMIVLIFICHVIIFRLLYLCLFHKLVELSS